MLKKASITVRGFIEKEGVECNKLGRVPRSIVAITEDETSRMRVLALE
jgi:hypothetical protein